MRTYPKEILNHMTNTKISFLNENFQLKSANNGGKTRNLRGRFVDDDIKTVNCGH